MTEPRAIRVMCADDHELIRDGIAYTLQMEPGMDVVASVANGFEAVESYRSLAPDIVLMDIRMPGMDGIEALQIIRQHSPGAKCLMLTTYEEDALAYRALKAGAMGYLLKTMIRKQLVDAIRIVFSGRRYIPPEIAMAVTENLATEDLSPREVDVLRSIASGCSNKIIADRLRLSENTVKGHIKKIVAKLGAEDRAHAVYIAMRRGLLERQ